jgi:hypothetical protein
MIHCEGLTIRQNTNPIDLSEKGRQNSNEFPMLLAFQPMAISGGMYKGAEANENEAWPRPGGDSLNWITPETEAMQEQATAFLQNKMSTPSKV